MCKMEAFELINYNLHILHTPGWKQFLRKNLAIYLQVMQVRQEGKASVLQDCDPVEADVQLPQLQQRLQSCTFQDTDLVVASVQIQE